MKFSVLAIALLMAIFGLMSPAIAANSSPVTQLLENRVCIQCDLHEVDLHQADLRGVNLSRANLRAANLKDALLMAVNLKGADLRGADLTGSRLLTVNFTDANLRGAKLDGLDPSAVTLCRTVMPDGATLDRDCS